MNQRKTKRVLPTSLCAERVRESRPKQPTDASTYVSELKPAGSLRDHLPVILSPQPVDTAAEVTEVTQRRGPSKRASDNGLRTARRPTIDIFFTRS